MNEKEKEKYILNFIYTILNDKRNQNRYCTTMFGKLDENKFVRLADCISYLENNYKELLRKEYIMEEKTSEELFDDLGLYLERETPFDFELKNDDDKIIKINKERREIACFNYYDGFEYLTLEELQAINKKVEELGWVK